MSPLGDHTTRRHDIGDQAKRWGDDMGGVGMVVVVMMMIMIRFSKIRHLFESSRCYYLYMEWCSVEQIAVT